MKDVPLQYRLAGVASHSGSGLPCGNRGGNPNEGAADGHYIASVQGQNRASYPCISDSELHSPPFTDNQFVANPQRTNFGSKNRFEIVSLTYIKNEEKRASPKRK
ncbi:hypothetical protein CC80DRAFT_229564 [Byssothecium circinans]|uniref:Uncharacterized protein n=1 Tax=Byssothecium circinans TaxID=147558 RepID=A0A6A5U8M9_9PLEO|nr:hypothetical protein CC80DRAFT_229564 [Byssothecium circinans]